MIGYSLAIKLIFSKIWTFLILLSLSSFPSKKHIYWLFLIFCSRVSVKIWKNGLKLPKLFIFLFFCIFHKNCRILDCFHRRYKFCMQKYPNKHISIEFAGKAYLPPILSKACDKTNFLKNLKISNFALFVFFSI